MTELPEISTSQGQVLTTIDNLFQSVSPAAAFGIDWRNTEALTLGIFGGIAPDGTEIAAQTKLLSASNTNYVEMTTAGVVSTNTAAYTAGRVKLFRVVTNANGIGSYTDDRSYSPGGLRFAGPSTDNAIARFDGTTGMLQNSTATISDGGALSITQATITDPANAFTVASTWNDAADTFVGASIDVTDTASAATSLLQRWRVGGVEMASIRKDGFTAIAGPLAVNGSSLSSAASTFSLLLAVTTLNVGTSSTTIRLGGSATGFGFGASAAGNVKYNFGGAHTSSGVSNTAIGVNFNVDVTGAAGDTSYLSTFANQGSITTQGATEAIAVVATMRLSEPVITVGSGDTVTLASTLHIASVPTEGTTNAALSIAAGNLITVGSVHVGSITVAPASQFDVSASTGGILTLRRIDTSVTANDMVGKIQFYAADTSTTSNFIVADIEAQATNTVSTDINPGRLIFRTTGTGVAATPTERFRLDEAGNGLFAGNVRIGSAVAPTVALDVTGAALISTDLGVTGVTGLGVASSSTSALTVAAATTGLASLRIPHGTAPSSPVNGDVWTTTAGLFVRINGATVGPLS